jgi:hypothetical protein
MGAVAHDHQPLRFLHAGFVRLRLDDGGGVTGGGGGDIFGGAVTHKNDFSAVNHGAGCARGDGGQVHLGGGEGQNVLCRKQTLGKGFCRPDGPDGQGRAGGKGEEITTIDSRLGHGMDDGLMKGTAFLYDIFLAAIKVKNTVCFSLGVSSPYRFLP